MTVPAITPAPVMACPVARVPELIAVTDMIPPEPDAVNIVPLATVWELLTLQVPVPPVPVPSAVMTVLVVTPVPVTLWPTAKVPTAETGSETPEHDTLGAHLVQRAAERNFTSHALGRSAS
jgi:hypothetical protein